MQLESVAMIASGGNVIDDEASKFDAICERGKRIHCKVQESLVYEACINRLVIGLLLTIHGA